MVDRLYIEMLDNEYRNNSHKYHPIEQNNSKGDARFGSGNQFKSELFLGSQDIFVMRQYYEFFEASKLHSQNHFEINYVAKGKATQYLENETIELSQGDFFIMTPNAVHNLYIHNDKEDIIFNLLLSVRLFNNAFFSLVGEYDIFASFFAGYLTARSDSKDYIYFQNVQTKELDTLIEALIWESIEKNSIGHTISVKCKLILIFTEIMRVMENRAQNEAAISNVDNPIKEIIQYIKDNYATVSLKSVAEYFHYHPNYLSALIKKYLNKSFTDLVNEIRQTHAFYYLTQTNLPIKDISDLIGYKNLSTFYAAIKKEYNLTPQELRLHGFYENQQ